jgi:hypothetical protein
MVNASRSRYTPRPTLRVLRPINKLFGLGSSGTSHTAPIDRNGSLVANIEGARFTATELRDLVQTVLNQ